MTAKFGVLGPLYATGHDGRQVRLRGERQRSLLAVLLFHANSEVPTDRVVDALWPDLPPKSYASNLHTYVSRLRERLGPLIEHTGAGYRITLPDTDLDLLVFRDEAARGRQALGAGEPIAAAAHFRLALAQWRDHPLADLHLPALEAEVARLETERLTVFEDCVEAELAAGRHTELVAELEAAVAAHPLRERLVGQLMLAQQRAGRQADALATYRDARDVLIEETGLEPGAELRATHAEILQGDWPIHQLPADIRVFTGRTGVAGEVAGLLTGPEPVVVLTGEPGVGKSALAVHVAHRLADRFPDGQLYAHLAGATAPRPADDVLADLLRGLGVTGPAIPDDPHAKAAVLRSRLAGRRVLLVLNDAADPAQVRPLLPGTPDSAVLITSRRRLSGLVNAHRVTVGSLTDGEARDLLTRLAGDRVAAEPDGVARISAACGNLPLALRIAGTRLALRPQLRLATLADRLEDERRRLDELSVSDLQVRSSLALSYAALTTDARTTFRRIGAAAVGDLPSWAVTVLQDGAGGERAVDELVESSLLQPVDFDRCGEPRYQVHDLVLTFARELLLSEDGAAECDRAADRLLTATLALADRFGADLPRPFPAVDAGEELPEPPADAVATYAADPLAWFEAERPALLGGMARIREHRTAARIFERLARYLWAHGSYADLSTCATALLGADDEAVAVWAEAVLARVLHVRGQYAEAVAKYRWCVTRLSDGPLLAWLLTNLADCRTGLGGAEEALALTDRAAQLSTVDAVAAARSNALNRLGRQHESVRVDATALAQARASASPHALVRALGSLSWSRALTGDLALAADLAVEAVTVARAAGDRSALARTLRTLGAIHAGRGERDRALEVFEECRVLAVENNEEPRVLSARRAIAAGWVGAGRAAEAVAELRSCLAEYRAMGSTSSAAITLHLLAAAHDAAGEPAAAAAARVEAERIADPRDANVRGLTGLLLNLTRAPLPLAPGSGGQARALA